MTFSFKENRTIEVQSFSDEEHEFVSAAIYSAAGNKEMSQAYIDKLTALLDLQPARTIQDRLLLLKSWGAIQNALNSGDIQGLRDVAHDLERVLGITAEFEPPPGWKINPEYETATHECEFTQTTTGGVIANIYPRTIVADTEISECKDCAAGVCDDTPEKPVWPRD